MSQNFSRPAFTDGTYSTNQDGFASPVNTEALRGYIVAVRSLNGVPTTDDVPRDSLIGKWTDTVTGVVYWDEVELIDDLLTAGNVARRRGEIAIWDCLNNREFRV